MNSVEFSIIFLSSQGAYFETYHVTVRNGREPRHASLSLQRCAQRIGALCLPFTFRDAPVGSVDCLPSRNWRRIEATGQRTEKITCGRVYLLLLVPIMLFVFSCFIRPAMVFDTAAGFAVFRSMLEVRSFQLRFLAGPFKHCE